jgi:LCP family protein required for cell wall assembly
MLGGFVMVKNKRLRRQLNLVAFLMVVFAFSVLMIYLGATVFRSQLPFFQLIDRDKQGAVDIGPEPETNPGATDLDPQVGVGLYMVLGSDFRPQSGFRTDTLILVAVDRSSGKASIVSFPRDLWVTIPGYGEGRINTVMQLGGYQLFANTMQTNFGVYPTQYAMINMEGFLKVIDTLGGVEFTTDTYTGDACDGSLNPTRWCEVNPGEVSMDSDMALWYVRARYNSSDFDRMRRTQEVVKAVLDKAATPLGLLKLPQLMAIYESEIESNIPPDQVLPLARFGLGFNSNEDIRRFVIGPNEVTSWTTYDGAAVLLPNIPAIQAILQEALTFE